MRKFRPELIQSFGKNSEVIPNTNPIQVRLEQPGALYWHRDDLKLLIGYGTEFTVALPDLDCTISANQPGNIELSHKMPILGDGEIFTNFDKRPMMSPAEQAVTRALRKLNFKMKELDALRREADKKHMPQPEPEPVPEPVPDPAPEPAPDATEKTE